MSPTSSCAHGDCGYHWGLVQEHTVEEPDGSGVRYAHLPNRLVCANSRGESASIVALIKTQRSDTKLVGQMQPYDEARGFQDQKLGGRTSRRWSRRSPTARTAG